jgi:hypothetical protein
MLWRLLLQNMFRLLFLGIMTLSACSAIPSAPEASSPTTAAPNPKLISTLGTPHIEQPPDAERQITPALPDAQNCGYQWAYQDLPELSSRLQQSLQTLQPDAQATAFSFGENCILPDGSVGDFLAMETDFNLTLQVADLNNETELGEWIVNVMQVIMEIPPEQILGPRPGRVSLTFQSTGEERHVAFYITQYQELPPGLSPVEILQQLQTPQ